MNNKKEYIICAAIHFKNEIVYKEQPINVKSGIVIAGRRHSDCCLTIINLIGDDFLSKYNHANKKAVDGFITSTNRFVDRYEAYKIAKEQNQVLYEESNSKNKILVSENLY